MNKKTILITVLILILAIGGVLGYLFFFKTTEPGTTGEGGAKSILDYFPFGKKSPTPTPGQSSTTTDQSGDTDGGLSSSEPLDSVPVLRGISSDPVAGAIVYDQKITITTDGIKEVFDKTFIRFVDKATGHVYETATDSLNNKKITNTTIPKIYEAMWHSSTTAFFRYLSQTGTIQTYTVKIKEATTTDTLATLDGLFLPDNIKMFGASASGANVFFTLSNAPGSFVSKSNNQSKISLSSLAFNEWTPQWAGETSLFVTTNPSAAAAGYTYTVNPSTGAMKKVLGDIPGLTTNISPEGTHLMYSATTNDAFEFNGYVLASRKTTPLRVKTMPEKCVWSASGPTAYCAIPEKIFQGVYPDDWYKGILTFTDNIWSVNADTGEMRRIFTLSDKESVDAINLKLNSKEDTLIFMNKKDSSLWSLNLKPAAATN